jgi:glycosyltransferase involved in cell wall biosynthesis
MKDSVVAVAQVLPANVRNHLRALADERLLRKAFTGYAYRPKGRLEQIGRHIDSVCGTKLTAQLSGRSEIVGVSAKHIKMSWLAEAAGLVFLRLVGGGQPDSSFTDWIQSRLSVTASRALKTGDRLVLAREHEANEVFQKAADLGICRFYQLPTPHFQTVDRIVRRELNLYPDPELQKAHEKSVAPHRIERKKSELALASRVLVPSLFVKRSLLDAGVCEEKIRVLPSGTEVEWIPESAPGRNPNLFLHVGQLSVRKGTHRLLKAWKCLGAYRTCELRLIGSMRLSSKFLSDYQGVYTYFGKMPRQSLKHQYMEASCFLLPALAEGFAMVILESLSCGTPIVASRNSGAEGFICEGKEGLLHDAQDDEQLCEALEWMLTHPDQRTEMSANCLRKASSWTWGTYRDAFVNLIFDLIDHGAQCSVRVAS